MDDCSGKEILRFDLCLSEPLCKGLELDLRKRDECGARERLFPEMRKTVGFASSGIFVEILVCWMDKKLWKSC